MSWNIDYIDKQPVNKFVLNGTVYLFKSYLSFLIKICPVFIEGPVINPYSFERFFLDLS